MSKYIIIDLDNCISNDAHRIPLINWREPDQFKRYDRYHRMSTADVCHNRDLFEVREEKILVFTSRPVAHREITERWLERVGVPVHALLMRNDADFRSSVEVKRTQLSWLEAYDVTLPEIVCAYDDREAIITMYREHGLPAELRKIHDVSAYREKE